MLEAVSAINGFGAVRLERDLRIHATASANGVKHLALRTIVTAAAITATTPAATSTTTVLLSSIPAGFAFSGGLETLGLVKVLLFVSENEASTTSGTNDFCCWHIDWNLCYSITFFGDLL